MYCVTSWWMNEKRLLGEQVRDVVGVAGDEVVDAEDLVPVGEKPLAEMGADESRPAGDHHLGHRSLSYRLLRPEKWARTHFSATRKGTRPSQLSPTDPRPIE